MYITCIPPVTGKTVLCGMVNDLSTACSRNVSSE